MKNTRVALVAGLLLLFLGASSLFAQDATVTPTRKPRPTLKAIVQERREAVASRFAEIRDARKQALLERIENALANINERRTNHFSKVLDRLSEILDKLEVRADAMEGEGEDVSTVDTQIEEARAAIDEAQDAVDAQAAKVYTLEITDEETLRAIVGQTFKKLQEDLRAVGALVKDARTAVADVFRALAQIAGESDDLNLSE
jgi:archaellum component FlaC